MSPPLPQDCWVCDEPERGRAVQPGGRRVADQQRDVPPLSRNPIHGRRQPSISYSGTDRFNTLLILLQGDASGQILIQGDHGGLAALKYACFCRKLFGRIGKAVGQPGGTPHQSSPHPRIWPDAQPCKFRKVVLWQIYSWVLPTFAPLPGDKNWIPSIGVKEGLGWLFSRTSTVRKSTQLSPSLTPRLCTVIQWSAVRVTVVTVTVGYSEIFGNPRFI